MLKSLKIAVLSWSLNSEQTGCVPADKSKYFFNYRIRQMKLLLNQEEKNKHSLAWRSCQGLGFAWGAQTFQKPGSDISSGCKESCAPALGWVYGAI